MRCPKCRSYKVDLTDKYTEEFGDEEFIVRWYLCADCGHEWNECDAQ